MQPSKHARQAVKDHRPARRRIQQRMHRRDSKVEPHAPEIQEGKEAKRLPDCDGVVAGGVVDEDIHDTEKDVDGDYGAHEPEENGREKPWGFVGVESVQGGICAEKGEEWAAHLDLPPDMTRLMDGC